MHDICVYEKKSWSKFEDNQNLLLAVRIMMEYFSIEHYVFFNIAVCGWSTNTKLIIVLWNEKKIVFKCLPWVHFNKRSQYVVLCSMQVKSIIQKINTNPKYVHLFRVIHLNKANKSQSKLAKIEYKWMEYHHHQQLVYNKLLLDSGDTSRKQRVRCVSAHSKI